MGVDNSLLARNEDLTVGETGECNKAVNDGIKVGSP